MEYIETIIYVLSIFLPALFFLLGLFLARWIWFKDTGAAFRENDKLRKDISALGAGDFSGIKSKVAGKLQASEDEWSLKFSDKDKEIAEKGDMLLLKEDELAKTKTQFSALNASEKDLKLKLDGQNKKFMDLDSAFTRFKTEKDTEVNSLMSEKSALASDSGNSAELEGKLVNLQSDYDRMELEKKSNSQTITNLIAKVDALEAEKAEKDTEVNSLMSEKSALASGSGNSAELEGKLVNLQSENDRLELEKKSNSQTITDLTEKVEALEAEDGSGEATAGTVDVKKIEPAAFFAGSQATEDDRYGFIYDEQGKTDYVDDLTEIKGVGEVLQPELNKFGVYQFKQIALWDQDNIDAFQTDLDFPGRVEREQWVNQAADLHRKHTGQHLAPVVDIYHPAPRPARKPKEEVLAQFAGEDVTADEDLGVIFNSRPDEVDDLKLIKGVAGVLEGKLHEIGIYRFRQVASWDETHMEEFSNRLAFPGRIQRDNWKDQSKQFHKDKYGEDLS